MHFDSSVLEPIDPAAIGKPHLEQRRHGEQPPAVAAIGEDAQAARPRDVVGIARDREYLVQPGVADGELRGEDAMHPAGDRERPVVG